MFLYSYHRFFYSVKLLFIFITLIVSDTVQAQVKSTDLWESIVKYQPSNTEFYLGSPCIVRYDENMLIVSLDYFGKNRPRDEFGRSNRTSIFSSNDEGKTWNHVSDIDGMYWGTLFKHDDKLYLLGNAAAMSHIVILESRDRGKTWTKAVDGKSGLLFHDGGGKEAPRYHGAPTPVVFHGGRIYRAFENQHDGSLPGMRGYNSLVVSAPAESNLLDAKNWTKSNELSFSDKWDRPGSNRTTGWIEGNIVVAPDGGIRNILRVNSTPFYDRAAMIRVHDEGVGVSFDPKNDFINLPGAQSKFQIRFDSVSNLYWMMTNNNTYHKEANPRNVLSLYASNNLRDWFHAKTLMEDDQGFSAQKSVEKTGFQYPDFIIDQNQLLYLSRTAYGEEVPRAHDSNYITFGRVTDFRKYVPEELK